MWRNSLQAFKGVLLQNIHDFEASKSSLSDSFRIPTNILLGPGTMNIKQCSHLGYDHVVLLLEVAGGLTVPF
jgi:hypothetical protein